MSRVHTVVKSYPLLSFFVGAYAITWSLVFGVVGLDGIRSGELEMSRGMFVWLGMLAGPSIAGIVLTYLASGRPGLRDFRERLRRWRVPAHWYATLLITPIVGTITVAGLMLISSDFTPMLIAEPDKIVIIGMFVVLIVGAAIEELGWTGYATPYLRRTHGLVGGALVLGTLHGTWHFLADFSGRADAAPVFYYPRFVVFWIVALVALRLLIMWVYAHTESLLLGQLIHASYTAPLFLLTPPDASATQLLLLWSVFTIAFLSVVVFLVFGRVGALGHQPLRRKLTASPR